MSWRKRDKMEIIGGDSLSKLITLVAVLFISVQYVYPGYLCSLDGLIQGADLSDCCNFREINSRLALNSPDHFFALSDSTDGNFIYESSKIKFEASENINGEGFANVRQSVSNPRNDVLSRRESGSGSYSSNSTMKYYFENISYYPDDSDIDYYLYPEEYDGSLDYEAITLNIEKISANYNETRLSLSPYRSLNFDARWSDVSQAISKQAGTSLIESYRYASGINKSADLSLDSGSVDAKSSIDLQGAADIQYKSPSSCYRERYMGAFEKLTEYNSEGSVSSLAGTGFVDIDKRIKREEDMQRTEEHGSGNIKMDERINPKISYVEKSIALTYKPFQFAVNSRTRLNTSLEWDEGILSRAEVMILEMRSLKEMPASEQRMGRSECSGCNPARGLTSMKFGSPRPSQRRSTRPASLHPSPLHTPRATSFALSAVRSRTRRYSTRSL